MTRSGNAATGRPTAGPGGASAGTSGPVRGPGPVGTVLVFLLVAWVFFVSEHGFGYARHEARERTTERNVLAAEKGRPARRAAFLLLGVWGLMSLIRRGGNPLRSNGPMGRLMLAFLAWAWLSLAWAQDGALAFRRLVLLSLMALGALALARRFSPRRVALLALLCSGAYLAIGLAAEVSLGTFRPLDASYRFAGTLHPNMQGLNAGLLLVAAVSLFRGAGRGQRRGLAAVAAAAFLCLVLTRSRAAFAATGLALGIYAAVTWPRRRKAALFLAAGVLVCMLLLLVGDAFFPALERIALLGREQAGLEGLTGRVPLWNLCLDYAGRRPLVGYGYNSFFNPERLKEVGAELTWRPSEAHSAYLDLLLGVGGIGLVLYVLILLSGVVRAFARHARRPEAGYAFFAMVLVLCAANGLLESAAGQARLAGFLSWAAFARLGFRHDGTARETNERA